MSTHCQFCTVHLGDLLLGIDVVEVQEVIRAQPMTRVPLAGPGVRGLINLRGHIVTAVDLRERFGLPPLDHGRQAMNVVVRTAAGPVSLLVDRIGDVLEAASADREALPANVAPAIRALVAGIYKLPGRLLLVLDTARTLGLDAGWPPGRTPGSILRGPRTAGANSVAYPEPAS